MRPIAADERAILERLVSLDFPGAVELRAQAEAVLGVEPSCDCGCGSITLWIDRTSAPPAPSSGPARAELYEISRTDGVPRSVILLVDADGYMEYLECIYNDDAIAAWPEANDCAVVLSDKTGRSVAAVLPNGSVARPQDPDDHWQSINFTGGAVTATTVSGSRETFDAEGNLVSRGRQGR